MPEKIFLSYAREDRDIAERLYADLESAGLSVWMDIKEMVPGQRWKLEIHKAIEKCRYFIALLSSNSVDKNGYVQKELKIAMEKFDLMPQDKIFLIPVRKEECRPRHAELNELHWADLFPAYDDGLAQILRVFERTESVPENKLTEEKVGKILEDSDEKSPFENSLGMKFVYIPPGSFMMGQTEEEKNLLLDQYGQEEYDRWFKRETPRHEVILTRGFYLQTTPVTVGQWRRFVAETGYQTEAEKGDGAYVRDGSEWTKKGDAYWAHPYFDQSDDHPVTCISWNDAQAFIDWLNGKKEGTYRLPTEAEWEYAARAGSTTPFYFGKCLSTDDANYDGNYPLEGCPKGEYRRKTTPAGSLSANSWGLYDMHGNVWEWCQDWSGDYPSDAVTDPVGPDKGSGRVMRGGSWGNYAVACRSANRVRSDPGDRDDGIGFRLSRSVSL